MIEHFRYKYFGDAMDNACKQIVGHNNWGYADQLIDSDTVQCSLGDDVVHLIAIYRDSLKEEEEE